MQTPASPALRRAAAILTAGFVLLAGVTCTDSLTGPRSRGGSLARIGFAPVFSKAAADIYKDLVQFGLGVNNVHVLLKHANGQTAKDTVVAISAGQDSVAIEMSVTLNGSTETLGADIELRDGTQILFAGTQQIQARAGSFPSVPQIPMEYTGPGAAATAVLVDPPSSTIFVNQTATFHASGKDKNGNDVPDIVVSWLVKDAARGSVDNTGTFTPAPGRGTTDVIARLPNRVEGSAHISIVPLATKAALISGGNQTGVVGKALSQAIIVEARADDNLPVPNAVLTFSVTSGGGALDVTTVTTDANGRASVNLTLGPSVGANTIEVGGNGIAPLAVSANGTADTTLPQIILATGDNQVSLKDSDLGTPLKVIAQDLVGNRLAGVTVTFAVQSGSGKVNGATQTSVTSASDGTASATWHVGSSGIQKVQATITEPTASPVDFHALIAEKIVMLQEPSIAPQSGVPFAVQPKVQLRDNQDNQVKLAGVSLIANSQLDPLNQDVSSTLLGTRTRTTDANGEALWTDLAIAGTSPQTVKLQIVQANPQSIDPVFSRIMTLAVGLPNIVQADVPYYRYPYSTETPVTIGVRVTDGVNPVAGATMTFAMGVGACVFTNGNVSLTDATGHATIDVLTPFAAVSSCVVTAQPNGNPPESAKAKLNVYVAGDAYAIWRGGSGSDLENAQNWLAGAVPQATDSLFIAATAFSMPKLTKPLNTVGLAVETGASIDLNAQPVVVAGSLRAEGPVVNGSSITLTSESDYYNEIRGSIAANMIVGAPETKCSDTTSVGYYYVSGALNVNSLLTRCYVSTGSSADVTIAGDLTVEAPGGEYDQYLGTLTVGGAIHANRGYTYITDVKFVVGGDIDVASGAYFSVGGGDVDFRRMLLSKGQIQFGSGETKPLNMIIRGDLNMPSGSYYQYGGDGDNITVLGGVSFASGSNFYQSGAKLLVTGTSAFNGYSDLNGGTLELKKDFTFDGGFCESSYFNSYYPHVMRFSGDASLVTWNPNCSGGHFGNLEIATKAGGPGVSFTSAAAQLLYIDHLHVLSGGKLTLDDRFNVTAGNATYPGTGVIIDDATGQIDNVLPILVPGSRDCPNGVLPPTNKGPLSCILP